MTGRCAREARADEGACAAALAGLPGIGPASLSELLAGAGPAEAWEGVVTGRLRRPEGRRSTAAAAGAWDLAARRADLGQLREALDAAGVGVTWTGRPDYPAVLADDPLPPPVLFWRGDLGALSARRVALVGTRRCTPDGAATAFELGRDLAAAGVCVVSGLAIGIDGAAHRGALASDQPGATAGVAASGVDVAYPRCHAELWEAVVAGGAVLSETAPGRPAQAWRFPARNRIIAGLVDLVVVVESHAAGGSLITVDAALERGVEVRAVPGPVRSPASAGSNQLLYDGPGPVRSAQDVLDALGDLRPAPEPVRLPPPRPRRPGPSSSRHAVAPADRAPRAAPAGTPGTGEAGAVLEAVGWRPTSLNQVALRCGLGLATVAVGLERLARDGLVAEERGWWQRRA